MSKKLEIILLCNIKEQLREIERRAKEARYNMLLLNNDPTITQIGIQNVLFAVNGLKEDLEKFSEVTHNVR